MNKIVRLTGGFIVIQFVLFFVYLTGSHMFQLAIPRSYRYTYNSVAPNQSIYEKGDPIYFVSDVIRKRVIKTQWQDTIYCDNGKRIKKYPTQYRPPVGFEIPKLGRNVSNRTYDYPINESEEQCQLCGTVVAETEYGYSKNYQYCTKWFGVNGNNPELNHSVAINIQRTKRSFFLKSEI